MRPGELTRCCALLQQVGGKGANVARALRVLRGETSCLLLGFAAGHTGRLFAELAIEEGLAVELVACHGEMRLSTAVLTDDGSVSRLFECGPEITPRDEEPLLAAVADRQAAEGEWAVVDGAVPSGAGDDFYSAICRTLRTVGSGCSSMPPALSWPPASRPSQTSSRSTSPRPGPPSAHRETSAGMTSACPWWSRAPRVSSWPGASSPPAHEAPWSRWALLGPLVSSAAGSGAYRRRPSESGTRSAPATASPRHWSPGSRATRQQRPRWRPPQASPPPMRPPRSPLTSTRTWREIWRAWPATVRPLKPKPISLRAPDPLD